MAKHSNATVENKVIPLALLDAHRKNYNRHSDAQLADLRESLKQFGQVRSIVVQPQGKRYTIVAGHGIAQAAQAEGYTELRADVIPHSWSETRVLAYLAADNELGKHADPDTDQLAAIVREVMQAEGEALARLAAGEQAALDAILNAGSALSEAADAGELVDKAAELQKKWQVQRGDVWEIGRHILVCGDNAIATDVEKLLTERAALGIHDPPYGVKRDKGFGGFGGFGPPIARRQYKDDWDSERPSKEKFDFLLLHSVNSIIWGGNFFADILPQSTHWIVWDKNNTMPTFGDCELAWTSFDRKSVKKYEITYNGLIGKEKDRFHPTQKPLNLIVACVNDYTQSGDVIADFYCGSGTTLVACEQTGRIGRGMEIEPKYCAVTLERMSLLGLAPKRLSETVVSKHGKQENLGANTETRGRPAGQKSRVAGKSETAVARG